MYDKMGERNDVATIHFSTSPSGDINYSRRFTVIFADGQYE